MTGFQNALREFQEADTQVLGISIDTSPSAGAFAKSVGLTFPLLSDWPHYEVAHLYGTYREDRGFSRRVSFVIDKAGIVRGRNTEERNMDIHAQESLRVVKELEGKS